MIGLDQRAADEMQETALAANCLAVVLLAAKTRFVQRSDQLAAWCRSVSFDTMFSASAIARAVNVQQVTENVSAADADLYAITTALESGSWQDEATLAWVVEAAYEAQRLLGAAAHLLMVRAATRDLKFRFLLDHGPAVLQMEPELVSALALLEELVTATVDGDHLAGEAAMVGVKAAAKFLLGAGAC